MEVELEHIKAGLDSDLDRAEIKAIDMVMQLLANRMSCKVTAKIAETLHTNRDSLRLTSTLTGAHQYKGKGLKIIVEGGRIGIYKKHDLLGYANSLAKEYRDILDVLDYVALKAIKAA